MRWRWLNTLRCAATVASGVAVIRHRSAEPDVGFLALGSNSWPNWCRLNFCRPNPRALRSPWIWQRQQAPERRSPLLCGQTLPSSGRLESMLKAGDRFAGRPGKEMREESEGAGDRPWRWRPPCRGLRCKTWWCREYFSRWEPGGPGGSPRPDRSSWIGHVQPADWTLPGWHG